MAEMTKRTDCRICGANLGVPVFTLGTMPLPNALLFEKDLDQPEPCYPLDVHLCERCGLAQLGHVVNPVILFSDYTFFTACSGPSITHFAGLAEKLKRCYCVNGDFGVEIGCNDGTLTGELAKRGLKVIGVDGASNCIEIARKNHPNALFYDSFFNSDVAVSIKKEHGRARFVVACNVVAHIDNINDLMKGVELLLDSNGVFVVEVPSLQRLIDCSSYDTIYHEHVSYFSVSAFECWAALYGMYVDEVEDIDTHGGSIRVFIKRKEIPPSQARGKVQEKIEKERNSGCADRTTWKNFVLAAIQQRNSLVSTVNSLYFDDHQRIVGYGAPAKASVLLNYCRIGSNVMDFCTDTTPAKQGRYIPGARIPIVHPSVLHQTNDHRFALMHCWNYRDTVLRKEREWIKNGGTFIIPLPRLEVIGPADLK